jgi:hypothetical protein
VVPRYLYANLKAFLKTLEELGIVRERKARPRLR